MSRKKNRRRDRSKAEIKVEQQSVNEDNTNLETSSHKQSPSDVNTTVDTLRQADSTDVLPFPEHQSGENVSTTISCQNALLEVESAAKFPSIKPVDLDLNPIENHLENNVAGKKKRRRRKKKNKNNCTAAMANLEVTLPNAESAVRLPAQEPLQVTFPNAESAIQLPAQELQGQDMNLADNLEVKGGNRRRKKSKKKNLNKPTNNVLDVDSTAKLLAPMNQERDINMTEIEEKIESGEKPTSNVLDVDSTAKLLAPKNQESDINMTEVEEKSESGEKSASGKKKRKNKKKQNKPASNVIDVESTAEVLVPEHQERDISSHNNLEQKTGNGRKRKRGENIEPTSDDQHVELTAQLLPPDNQEKKKKKKRREVKKAANNNLDNVKTATQDSLSSAREETEVLGAGSVKLCPEDVNVVSVQTEHTPTVKATTTTSENYENGMYLAFPEKNSVESCSVGTHLPSSAEVTVHDGTPLKRKLLILDLNGLLADIVMPRPKDCEADASFLGRAIFKRPFCDDFLNFCFERFNVAIWSSRSKKIIVPVVKYLLGDLRHELVFCWDMSHSTMTRFKTLENRHKPLVCKDLRKIWNPKRCVPWEKGDFDESNTLLLDDSPYKALLNPAHTTIFPYSYNFRLKNDDNSLGPGGDLRVYLENLVDAEHVQKYVEEHPFGQPAINEKSAKWGFYSRVIQSIRPQANDQANCGDSV